MNQAQFMGRVSGLLRDNGGVRRLPADYGAWLNPSRLAGIGAGDMRGLYHRGVKNRLHAYRVVVMVDCSGSMASAEDVAGGGYLIKYKAGALVLHALSYALTRSGVAVEGWTFEDEVKPIEPGLLEDVDKLTNRLRPQ